AAQDLFLVIPLNVTNVRFTYDDSYLVSVGGDDCLTRVIGDDQGACDYTKVIETVGLFSRMLTLCCQKN
uniref:Peptidase A1 domain-containing protein n=1 Tax=Macrostomum lignano TaxID=282301 RepID=A0A1I8F869_9PLAT